MMNPHLIDPLTHADIASTIQTHHHQTQAMSLAMTDAHIASNNHAPRFSLHTRPVIRWIKGDGRDDDITRAAIGQATRLFGNDVDYCLCTQGIDASRAHRILELANQAVEWWPISENDNPQLAQILIDANCPPEKFGYWWKWFPERARPNAPEWILDGDMVIIKRPPWYQQWLSGQDAIRVTQDDLWEVKEMYGRYIDQVNLDAKLYSGLISLPPGQTYMPQLLAVLNTLPLQQNHDGTRDTCEQGVIAAAFDQLNPIPIPLYEFPFARSYEENLNFGAKGNLKVAWGCHFGNSFRTDNPHFHRLVADGVVFSKPEISLLEKFKWLSGTDQWGTPGWSMPDDSFNIMIECAKQFIHKPVLELGTSRGRLAAALATIGCDVTTVDHQDRGARKNLADLSVNVVVDDAVHFLQTTAHSYDLIICDFHGNSTANWQVYAKPILAKLNQGGTLLIHNAILHYMPEWHEENGVSWFIKQLPADWLITLYTDTFPGIAIVKTP